MKMKNYVQTQSKEQPKPDKSQTNCDEANMARE